MKGLVLITYRDRQVHLDVLTMYLSRYFPNLDIAVIEQCDNNIWNKGLLYNVGYKLLAADYDYVILHDVDFIPSRGVDYSYCEVPTLISTECSQFNYGQCYPAFFGGVVGVNKDHYDTINGFSNRFRGYGGEDDSFYQSFISKGITPQRREENRFENFTHPRPDSRPGTQFFNSADYQNNLKLATSPRDFSDGLSNCIDYIKSTISFSPSPDYKHWIKIITNG